MALLPFCNGTRGHSDRCSVPGWMVVAPCVLRPLAGLAIAPVAHVPGPCVPGGSCSGARRGEVGLAGPSALLELCPGGADPLEPGFPGLGVRSGWSSSC